ncbi:MAG: hypothetical protein IT314_10230 [Anaerolineales bacterium]|nr:hypothetical protein [Anaerolineales bacterium]
MKIPNISLPTVNNPKATLKADKIHHRNCSSMPSKLLLNVRAVPNITDKFPALKEK